ncbi:MAG TPA: winged helix DNA-binding domain-containing protein [Chloroflexia bacterium]|nr:winged helix DNA-binding domain-containing protein [Chloroflexia bacterium]
MTNPNIAHRRLHNQHIASAVFEEPTDVVEWLGAVQSQDYAGARWAVGQRLRGSKSTDAAIERAFDEGTILRTHLMRPTWHFVTRTDIRWMLALTAPRVNAGNAYYYRQLDLDEATLARTNALLAKALQGGKHLTRTELAAALEQGGIATKGPLRFGYIMMRAELDGIVCSGPRRGKQFTYALLDERAPQARSLERDKALATLVGRYFTSHGPATVQDFVWWSGLTAADARAGLAMLASQITHEVVGSKTYWFAPSTPPAKNTSPTVHLLPNYDEYHIGYKDHSPVFDAANEAKLNARNNVFSHLIAIDGLIIGTWKRTLKKDAVIIERSIFAPLHEAEACAFAVAAERYGRFVGLPVTLQE